MSRILLIEDDKTLADSLARVLELEGYSVAVEYDGARGLVAIQAGDFDAVVTDLQLPSGNGLKIVEALHSTKPRVPVILMTAFHTTEDAIEATKLGAYEYLIKSMKLHEEILEILKKAVAGSKLMSEEVVIGAAGAGKDAIVGRSRVMQKVFKDIGRVAARPLPVLIRGEPGTGKKLVARAVYQHSERAGQRFVVVNCVAAPEAEIERELFGHEARSFPGAGRRIGKFEQVKQGTILLDEIGELGLGAQNRLIRVLKDRSFLRIGGKVPVPVDVRVVATTERDLELGVKGRGFSEELLDQLNDAAIFLPPLRDRKEDIAELVIYLLGRHGPEMGFKSTSITPGAIEYLQRHSWPGNVRELEKTIRRCLLATQGYIISEDHVREALGRSSFWRGPALSERGRSSGLVGAARVGGDAASGVDSGEAALEHFREVEAFGQKHRTALLTLLFTDMVGSTSMKRDFGDREAVRVMQRHEAVVRGILEEFEGGEEISTAGDSFFIIFAKPSDAVAFSLLLQSKLRAFAQVWEKCVQDRIGIHLGEVIVGEGRSSGGKSLYGMQIDVCSRVMSAAAGGQILMTRATFDNARQVLAGRPIAGVDSLHWENHGFYELKGAGGRWEICEVREAGSPPLKAPVDTEKVTRLSGS